MKIHHLNNNPTVKKHFLIALFGSVLGVLIFYYLKTSDSISNSSFFSLEVFLSACCGIAVSYLVYGITISLDEKIPWQFQLGTRLFVGILVHFLSAFVIVSGSIYLYSNYLSTTDSPLLFENPLFIKLAIILFIVMLFYTLIYFALYSYYTYSALQIATVKHEREQIDLQLKALKSQLSPHFLFNSLNSISSLIYSNTQRAETFIRQLAKMYQYTLNSYDKKLISLEKELHFVESYCFLLTTRFGNKFDCTINIPEAIKSSLIPPLTLQMLVENALKHNQMSTHNPLKIDISCDNDFIIIRNNITETPLNITSFKIGLNNINARYLLLHNIGIEVTNATNFSVKLPVIR